MAGFVLIHGAMHGGWCFDAVAQILRARGHRVAAPDLPGMGASPQEMAGVTLAQWARFTVEQCRTLRAELSGEPLVLAGHSRGGLVIGPAAERDPYAMDALAYISAMMPASGESGMDSRADAVPGPEHQALVRAFASGEGLAEAAVAVFAHLTEPELALAAMRRLVAEPQGPMREPLLLTPARWGSLPRLYIECLRDRTITLAEQRALQARAPGTRRISLDTDHSPFLSAPDALADALEAAIPR